MVLPLFLSLSTSLSDGGDVSKLFVFAFSTSNEVVVVRSIFFLPLSLSLPFSTGEVVV